MADKGGIRAAGFDVQATLDRVGRELAALGVDVEANATHPLGHVVFHHVGRKDHGGGMPKVKDCRVCGLLQAHWLMVEHQHAADGSEPWLALAEAAKQAAKHVRAAARVLEAPSKNFAPIAAAVHQRWRKRSKWMKAQLHEHQLICLDPQQSLRALRKAEAYLARLADLNTRLIEPQLRQPFGKKPAQLLLLEVEEVLRETGLSDAEVADLIREGGELGRVARIRARRAQVKKAR